MGSSHCRQVWNRFYGVLRAYPFSQDQTMCLISQCVVWYIVLYAFYRCNRFFLDRQREARHRAHRDRSNIERAVLGQLWSGVHSPTSNKDQDLEHPGSFKVPRRSRSASKKQPRQATSVTSDKPVSRCYAAEDGPHLVPLLISTRCTPSCARERTCAQKLKEAAAELTAPGQNVRHFQASGSFVQTQVKLMNDTANKLTGLAAQKYCDISVQLGRLWAACLDSDGAVKTFKLEESLMPVILHSSYAAGILTVEPGLNLTEATIHMTSKDKCISLETTCMKGPGGLEMHTCMCQLPFKSLAEVSVLAFKQIDVDEQTIRVSSAAVAIQDENFRTVFHYILPFWILIILGITQILSSALNLVDSSTKTFSIVVMIFIATQLTPQSLETSIRVSLKELVFTLYFTFQSFIYERDAIFSSFNAEDPGPLLRTAERDLSRPSPPVTPPRMLRNSRILRDRRVHGRQDSSSSESDDNLCEDQAPSSCKPVSSPESSSDPWQWPVYDTLYDRHDVPYKVLRVDGKKIKTNAMHIPFKVIYLNLKNLPWANQVLVKICSPLLKGAIQGLKPDQRAVWKTLKMSRPALFHIRGELRDRRNYLLAPQQEPSSSTDATTDSAELQHLSHLVRFMDEEFKEIEPMYTAMREERHATWTMLWAFFPPGERVVFCDAVTKEKSCGSVIKAQYQIKRDGVELVITVSKWDYNCETYKESSENFCYTLTVPAFENEVSIESLSIHPVQYEKDPEATDNRLLERGTKFCELSMMQRSHFMNYKGSMIIRYPHVNGYEEHFADGRVMIDLGSFAKMNPTYPMWSAKPPCEIIRDNKVECIDIRNCRDRMFAPHLVYGFSFRLKKWGSFSVGGFTDIVFNDAAFDDLVMDANTKDLTENLVREHLKGAEKDKKPENYIAKLDPIVNKGEGCVFLCYGPPGTGKTLTAESLSEKLHCPLWSLNVSELGITPSTLETTLVQVMDVAALWGAILLLDEADVYLEQRSSSDMSRNAMTGVFLRQLEYHCGVIFLTTNRDSAFDEAISSRIAHFLYYARLNKEKRSTVWSNLFRHVGLKASSEVVAEFSEPEINGREIRNIMQTAQTLARSKVKEVGVEDVRQALTVYVASFKLRASITPNCRRDQKMAFG